MGTGSTPFQEMCSQLKRKEKVKERESDCGEIEKRERERDFTSILFHMKKGI